VKLGRVVSEIRAGTDRLTDIPITIHCSRTEGGVINVMSCAAVNLAEQWNERLNLQYLRRLFHQNVVILEPGVDQVTTFQCRVRTRHRDDLCLFDK